MYVSVHIPCCEIRFVRWYQLFQEKGCISTCIPHHSITYVGTDKKLKQLKEGVHYSNCLARGVRGVHYGYLIQGVVHNKAKRFICSYLQGFQIISIIEKCQSCKTQVAWHDHENIALWIKIPLTLLEQCNHVFV